MTADLLKALVNAGLSPDAARSVAEYVQDNSSAVLPFGGASLVDLGIVNIVDLVDGPETLYTPNEGEYVMVTAGPDGFVVLDGGTLLVGEEGQFESGNGDYAMSANEQGYNGGWNDAGKVRSGAPIKAWASVNNNGSGLAPWVSWEADHLYSNDPADVIVEDGRLWTCSVGGTSASSRPDFEGGNSIPDDNGVQWYAVVAVPTVGSVHFYALVVGTQSTPATLLVATTVLSPAQILDLQATPIQLAASPGPGKTWLVIDAMLHRFNGTTPYTGHGGRILVGPRAAVIADYSTWETPQDPPLLTSAMLEGSDKIFAQLENNGGGSNIFPPALFEDEVLAVGNPNPDFTDGDYHLRVTVLYIAVDIDA